MTVRGWRRKLAAGACVAGLTLAAACGGDGDDGAEERSPLAEFFGWDDAEVGPGEFTEQDRQEHHELQQLIADCMQQAGFEYHPEPFWGDENSSRFEDPFEDVWALQESDPEAFAREYGYGITTVDYGDAGRSFATPAPEEDPNWIYRESLSAADQEEYDQALWGDWDDADEETGERPPEDQGCYDAATSQVYGDPAAEGEDETQFEGLWEEWDALEQRIQNDPRMAETLQGWTGCMAEAGYPGLTDLFGGQSEVHTRQEEVFGWSDGDRPTFDNPEEEAEYWDNYQPPEPDPEEVAALREFELAIAWADYECRQEHQVDEVEREVRHEHERQFIDDNRELLEQYRDYLDSEGRER